MTDQTSHARRPVRAARSGLASTSPISVGGVTSGWRLLTSSGQATRSHTGTFAQGSEPAP